METHSTCHLAEQLADTDALMSNGIQFFPDMEKRIVDILNAANARFYQDQAESFSQTRQKPWEGWMLIGEALNAFAKTPCDPMRIVDVGCGNMRFERFLESSYPHRRFEFTCIDSCATLVPENSGYRFMRRDIVSDLATGQRAICGIDDRFDAAVAFGLMHHIPGKENRCEFIRQLCASVRPGGLIALSFWQFMKVPKLEAKAQEATERAAVELGITADDLEENDFFLGWADDPSALRYCHHFDDAEIKSLIESASPSAHTEALYKADTANSYAILGIV